MTEAEKPPLADPSTIGGASVLSPHHPRHNRAGSTDRPDKQAPAVDESRPLRADAQRNRTKLLDAARTSFAATADPVPLETIAREAGVGIGTLYRHFPSREALIEAVYAAELDDVTASAPSLLKALPPERALRAWMERYAGFVVTKRALFGTVRAGWTPNQITTATTRARINEAIATLLSAGARSGTLRDDIDPDDVTAMLLGASLVTAANPEQTARLLDLLLDAVRTPSSR